ncbi:protein tyrosine kinase domain-containing protein [Ditylenchus destructor]|uniref:Protein tyrosine kinase domain-containing protein n=1 Tax=Ditylenchus destructor TaxID=166010 RepID=A0AAD4N8G8_9BILA|nr:protein tyrosine kinase domain-containing protein [Ditylenchus destructor]
MWLSWLCSFYLFIPHLSNLANAINLGECKASPLGMESGKIVDSQISASSSFDLISVGPQNSRIRTELFSGAWCPKQQIRNSSYEFLQVDLERNTVILKIETQGRYGNGTGREYVEQYFIDYWRIGLDKWIRYRNRSGFQLMDGNLNTVDPAYRTIDPPIVASKIRIVPFSSTTRTVCLRVEFHGCNYTDGLIAYSMSSMGSILGNDDLRDSAFEETGLRDYRGAIRGLGLLTDGYIAKEPPAGNGIINRVKIQAPLNSSWIGWNWNLTSGRVNILFEFENLRNFSNVDLFYFGHPPNSVEAAFYTNDVLMGTKHDTSVTKYFDPSKFAKATTLVKMHLEGSGTAKAIQLTLSFSHSWIYLTEVAFNTPGISLLAVLCFCILLLIKRNSARDKLGTTSAGDSFYRKPGLLVATLGGDGNQKPHTFTTILGHGTCSSFSYSSSLNQTADVKNHTSSLLSFNFPPPPPSNSTTSTSDEIYAEPCVSAPLLPPRLRGSTSATSTLPKKETAPIPRVPEIPKSSIDIKEKIGEGKFTNIFRCRCRVSQRDLVIKCIKPEDVNNGSARRALQAELETMSVLDEHPNVVKIIGQCENLSIVTEFVPSSDVRTFIRSDPSKFSSSDITRICASLASGMKYLESRNIVHGHLSPRSCLLRPDMHICIASPRGPNLHAQLRYSAPEAIVLDEWSSRSDVWSFAVVCWELLHLCSTLPYESLSNAQIVENSQLFLSRSPDTIYLDFSSIIVGADIAELLSECWNSDPLLRPNFLEIELFYARKNMNSDLK